MKRSIWMSTVLIFLVLVCSLIGCVPRAKTALDATGRFALAPDPLNATYVIEGREISLHAGCSEISLVVDSASKLRTSVFGAVVSGDLDDDGDDDGVLILAQDSGGSGTFYYLAVALNEEGQYRGTNALFLGDRITLQGSTTHSGIIETALKVRILDEPMSSLPSLTEQRFSRIDEGTLVEIEPLEGDEQILHGWVTWGHEVRSFTPCSQGSDFWISGKSPALADVSADYQRLLSKAEPYTPLFMTLAGRQLAAEKDGFGAEYAAAFLATQLIAVRPQGNCWSDSIIVSSPHPGETVRSPMVVQGRARGRWFFEGDFPLVLKNLAGRTIARGYATAEAEWMTEEFVPFIGTVEFSTPADADQGILVIKKDNPTGRKELDRDVKLRIFLK